MSELAIREELAPAESFRLTELEETIERGLAYVGQALAEIRDSQLWRGTHDTFQDYCLDRWSMSHRHANRKIMAAAVISTLGPIGPAPIESQARELAPLLDEPDMLRDAWEEASANGAPTAALVREAVEQRLGTAHVSYNAGDNEWYTPTEYVQAARLVMGAIDLDPASHEIANATVGAARFFTEQDDGLAHEWSGRVWMNPPYAAPLIGQFCSKLIGSFSPEGVTQACVLVNNATETGWFHSIASVASAVCFPRGRVKFWHPRKTAVPLQGQAVLYLGDRADAFAREFESFGLIVSVP